MPNGDSSSSLPLNENLPFKSVKKPDFQKIECTFHGSFTFFYFTHHFRVVLACLVVSMVTAVYSNSSVFIVCDSGVVRGDILQCSASVVDICTDDTQC